MPLWMVTEGKGDPEKLGCGSSAQVAMGRGVLIAWNVRRWNTVSVCSCEHQGARGRGGGRGEGQNETPRGSDPAGLGLGPVSLEVQQGALRACPAQRARPLPGTSGKRAIASRSLRTGRDL